MQPVHLDWVRKWAHYLPDKMALREHERDRQWNYGELNRYSDAIAAWLINELAVQKGDRIAVYSRNCAEYVFLFIAAMKAGAILVPLNFRLTSSELQILLGDSRPRIMFYHPDYQTAAAELQTFYPEMNLLGMASVTGVLDNPVKNRPAPQPDMQPDDVVMILYTSGTTGLPKGAMITHKMLFWNAINTALRLDITSADHTQSFAPFFHTGGWNVLFTPFLHHGASHTLLTGFDADEILHLMEKERSTLLFGVPTMMQMLVDAPGFAEADLSSVRYAIVGGAPMPIPLIETWHNKGIAIRQGYGLTEVGPNCFSLNQEDAIRKIGSIGFPNFYIEAQVTNPDGMECPVNEVGELWLKSPVVTPGYWNKIAETAAAITNGWFHTGDMMRRDEDGYYFVVDRKKNMYISGGENVYPAEIERIILTNEQIKEVAVIGVSDERWGETGCAFIVTKPQSTLNSEEVIAFCKGKMAKYKMPKYVYVIESLPLNEAGKINRFELQEFHNHSKP
jgi:fatty-acyl-CoA synthase